eukprot:1143052-Rhodomonas_salina.2
MSPGVKSLLRDWQVYCAKATTQEGILCSRELHYYRWYAEPLLTIEMLFFVQLILPMACLAHPRSQKIMKRCFHRFLSSFLPAISPACLESCMCSTTPVLIQLTTRQKQTSP